MIQRLHELTGEIIPVRSVHLYKHYAKKKEVRSMSKWAEHDIYAKLRDILASVTYAHHFGGRPFITAYQLAIEFARRHPDIVADLGKPIGGEGTGQQYSLSTYVAGILSQRIKDGSISDIEGSFLANLNLNSITFNSPEGVITSSLTGSPYPVSIFRLKTPVEVSFDESESQDEEVR